MPETDVKTVVVRLNDENVIKIEWDIINHSGHGIVVDEVTGQVYTISNTIS